MGYQESYFTVANYTSPMNCTSDNVKLDEIIEVIRKNGYEAYKNIGCVPVEIITLKQNVCDSFCRLWIKGTKFIYFVGERFLQSHGIDKLGNILLYPDCNTCEDFRGTKIDGGECGPWYCRKRNCEHKFDYDMDIIFTEDMLCDNIWTDSGNGSAANHDPFWT